MVNDILEQAAEDYFRHLGYLTQHNVKYGLKKQTPSDIDILAVNPLLKGRSRVVAASCKAWQTGFDIQSKIDIIEKDLKNSSLRDAKEKNLFREFAHPDWSRALTNKIKDITGQDIFEFYLIVTHYHHGTKNDWENQSTFKRYLPNCIMKLISLQEMIETVWPDITTTLEHSEFTRLLQLIKAGNGKIIYT